MEIEFITKVIVSVTIAIASYQQYKKGFFEQARSCHPGKNAILAVLLLGQT